jgi:hypothetical protein
VNENVAVRLFYRGRLTLQRGQAQPGIIHRYRPKTGAREPQQLLRALSEATFARR